ncbi:hypothetical protein FNV43_RR17206 [Rhamnella rubrinervis]|uniref:Uncharacterized protein n=1 Tax=Rhamnella rubrinervis TaxID=2594499 RepID=A0A8K0E257_9ROSA|nr:hypothetical protein FNV43_RR17206 [Rhamnella rubrinervis]
MANASHICLVFFVLMILSNEFVSIEARNLKQRKERKDSTFVKVQMSPNAPKTIAREAMVRRFASTSQLHNSVKELEGYVGAFRPTTPGHSPGVGHSIHN